MPRVAGFNRKSMPRGYLVFWYIMSNTYPSKCVSEKSFFSSYSDLLTCADSNNSKVQKSRIECDWETEFLCGDKCLGTSKYCACGKHYFGYEDSDSYICCQEPNTSCETRNGNITCQGEKQLWIEPCLGSCKQTARYGFTTLPCADQKECYFEDLACKGEPQCNE